MRWLLPLLPIVAMACSPSVRRIPSPTGQPGDWFVVRCKSHDDCQIDAAEACAGRGYDVFDQSTNKGVSVTTYGGGTTYKRSVTIRCHDSAPLITTEATPVTPEPKSPHKVKGSGYSFEVPGDWSGTEDAEGRESFQSSDNVHAATLSVTDWKGTADGFAATLGDVETSDVDLGGVPGLLAARKKNGRRLTTVLIVSAGTAYALTCSDRGAGKTSADCMRVVLSLRLRKPEKKSKPTAGGEEADIY